MCRLTIGTDYGNCLMNHIQISRPSDPAMTRSHHSTSDRHYSRIKLVLPQIHIILQTDLISIHEYTGLYIFQTYSRGCYSFKFYEQLHISCRLYIYTEEESQMLWVVCTKK